jgi:tetratricopeptide (TPR) repeat protein
MAGSVQPSRAEIERQLDRMLAHPVFRAREKQAEILAHMVRSVLAGEEITETHIQQEVFPDPPYDPEVSNVRTNVNSLRKTLRDDYYAGDGENDPVIIALPDPTEHKTPSGKRIKLRPGEAYTPTFSYNPRAPLAKQFALAHYFMHGTLPGIERALKQLADIQSEEPGHPEAALSFAEAAGCQLLMLGTTEEEGRGVLIDGLFALIEQCAPQGTEDWRVHNVRGFLFTVNGQFESAENEFAQALRLDRPATINRCWYALFLHLMGREQESLQLFKMLADDGVTNAQIYAVYGVFLFRSNRNEEAEHMLAQALTFDRNCWTAHYGLTQLYVETGQKNLAVKHAKRLKTLVEPEEFERMLRGMTSVPDPDAPSR